MRRCVLFRFTERVKLWIGCLSLSLLPLLWNRFSLTNDGFQCDSHIVDWESFKPIFHWWNETRDISWKNSIRCQSNRCYCCRWRGFFRCCCCLRRHLFHYRNRDIFQFTNIFLNFIPFSNKYFRTGFACWFFTGRTLFLNFTLLPLSPWWIKFEAKIHHALRYTNTRHDITQRQLFCKLMKLEHFVNCLFLFLFATRNVIIMLCRDFVPNTLRRDFLLCATHSAGSNCVSASRFFLNASCSSSSLFLMFFCILFCFRVLIPFSCIIRWVHLIETVQLWPYVCA